MKVLIWTGYYLLYAIVVSIIRGQGYILGGIPTMILFGLVSWAASASCKAYDRRKNDKKSAEIIRETKALADATIKAVEQFEKEDFSEYLHHSDATKVDTLIYSYFIVCNMCIGGTNNKALSSVFAERYTANIHSHLSMKNAKNSSFQSIFRERVLLYERTFASKQELKDKLSVAAKKFQGIIKFDVLNNTLTHFPEDSPEEVAGETRKDLKCARDVAVFGKFLLSYTKNSMEKVIETIK